MADANYTAGEGTATQLPRGEAQALNEGTDVQAPESMTVAPTEDTETSVEAEDTSEPELAQASDYEPLYQPETADEEFLTGPTTRPDEAVDTGAFAGGATQLPPDAAAWLPVFVEAAQAPDAPPQLKALVRILTSSSEL